jgi:hypothetical protein
VHSISDILNVILGSIFVGFGIVIPIVALIRTSNLKALEFKDLFILTAVQAVRVAGILFFVLWAVHSWERYNEPPIPNTVPFKDMLLGPYWLVYLFSPIMKFVLSQLFWIKKLYFKKAALITFALLLVIVPSQNVLMFVTSLQSDYLPSSISIADTLAEIGLNIVVFIFIIIPILLGSGKLKPKGQK